MWCNVCEGLCFKPLQILRKLVLQECHVPQRSLNRGIHQLLLQLLGFLGGYGSKCEGRVFVSSHYLLRISANNDLIAIVCRHLWRGVWVGLWGCWNYLYTCHRFALWWCRRHKFIAHYVCCWSECKICAWMQKQDLSIFGFMQKKVGQF